MKRREFLQLSTIGGAATMLPQWAIAADGADGADAAWRVFEVTTMVDVLFPAGATRVWLPVTLREDTDWQKNLGNRWSSAGNLALASDRSWGAAFLAADWPADAPARATLVSRVATRDRAVDVTQRTGARLAPEVQRHYLRATRLIPTDGIVLATAREATRGARSEEAQARALYEWICENTKRDPKVRGCGTGDIRYMLESGNLGGKCADLNALYVGMARSLKIPARDVYGVRVADSRLGYRSLGKSGDITRAQHCRAEYFQNGVGWVPVDPADVRKVILEEDGGKREDDSVVLAARKRLFGGWEMNWMAFNFAHDVELAGASRGPIGFLMYPQAETADGRLDSLDPDNFKYTMTSRELTSA
ncbi:MAG TPA: transglutaminase-like domain-containing protein [Casimicrobiaceae bacterium]